MKFDGKEKILRLTAEELVLSAAAYFGKHVIESFPVSLPAQKGDGEDSIAYADFSVPSFAGRLEARASLLREGERITVLRRFSLSQTNKENKKETLALLRGLGFALAYAFAGEGIPAFRMILSDDTGAEEVLEEAPDARALEDFFARLLTGLMADATHEISRVTERLPTFLSVPFPYPDVREGQRDMMSAVFTAAKQGEVLFATAPTGTGKTMAALFPALRAMGKPPFCVA